MTVPLAVGGVFNFLIEGDGFILISAGGVFFQGHLIVGVLFLRLRFGFLFVLFRCAISPALALRASVCFVC